MHLTTPRIAPAEPEQWSEEQRRAIEPMVKRGPVLNVFKTMLNDPKAYEAFMAWGGYILGRRNSLPAREREIVILRIGFLCMAGYEWTQHKRIGLESGLTDEDIERIKAGTDASGWSDADAALVQASDELHHRQFISDPTWARLKANFTDKQCMDVVFTAGQYTQVSMFLNTFGVQLDPGQVLDPDLKAF